jgi:carboxymethylenebutenolidase
MKRKFLTLFFGLTIISVPLFSQQLKSVPGNCGLFYPSISALQKDQQTVLSFYNFKPGETVASIGAQSCNWEAAYAAVCDSIQFFLEDIDSSFCNNLEASIAWDYYASIKEKPLTSSFVVVIGNEKQTTLKDSFFDKIIAVNSFHEFNFPTEMLADIAKKLKPNGTLYIDEAMAKYKGQLHPQCKKRKYMEDELISFFSQNGFVLQQSKIISWYKKKEAREIFALDKRKTMMKKIKLLLLLLPAFAMLHAQSKMSCCAPTSTEEFATLASNRSFVMSHPIPPPFVFQSARDGHDITYKTNDGADAHAWEIKAKDKSAYYLFVIHEYWGLNDYIKQEAEKLSDELDVNVIALDLYDGKVATVRDSAAKYMQEVKDTRALSIINGAYTYVGQNVKVFSIGWCFGGGWSLQAAIAGGAQAAGCIMYYGMPEKDINKLKTLQCNVVGFFANKDQWINPTVVAQFQADMKTAGKTLTVYQYDADHAFANPSNPKFDKAATADSYIKTISFIKSWMSKKTY